jgi:regulator of RNase E activity RraA
MAQSENLELIKLFEGLRVADVRDGMDWIGYHHYGSVASNFLPLFRTSVIGIARTARYLPYEGPTPRFTPEEYTEWVPQYYATINNDAWVSDIQPGDFMCLDVADIDVGLIGSANSLDQKQKGCVGYLLNGGARDTDELILQKIPIWCKFISKNMSQARCRFYEKDTPGGNRRSCDLPRRRRRRGWRRRDNSAAQGGAQCCQMGKKRKYGRQGGPQEDVYHPWHGVR